MSMIAEVREWLEKQGYSLEMRAASAFRAADFDIVRQSSYYIDSETSKAREIDVEVITQSIVGFLDVRFFVECKSGDKPWVLFSSADALMNYNRLFAFCAMSKRARKVCAEFDNPLELFGKFPWMKKDGVGGYSLRQAFSRDIDSAYAAAMNVVKACHNHVKDSTSPYDEKLHFAFPVIVVDKPIIRCTLDASGETELTEVEQGEFLFTGHEVGTCIRVVTIAHLPVFAKEAKQVVEQLEDEVRNEEKKMLDAMRVRRS